MREIRGRAVESDKGAVGRVNNRCAHRYECTVRSVCGDFLNSASLRIV